MRVLIHTHDPMLTLVRLPKDAIDLFGEDVLNEDGIEIPDALAIEADLIYKKLCELSHKLSEIKKSYEEKKYYGKT